MTLSLRCFLCLIRLKAITQILINFCPFVVIYSLLRRCCLHGHCPLHVSRKYQYIVIPPDVCICACCLAFVIIVMSSPPSHQQLLQQFSVQLFVLALSSAASFTLLSVKSIIVCPSSMLLSASSVTYALCPYLRQVSHYDLVNELFNMHQSS